MRPAPRHCCGTLIPFSPSPRRTGSSCRRMSERLLEERRAARAARDWARSDALRADLARLDVVVEDTADGQRWRILEVPHAAR